MRRSNFFIKLISIAMFFVLVCYIGYAIYDGYSNEFRTAAVYKTTVEDTMAVSGRVVRDEYILSGNNGSTAVLVEEGEKISYMQNVAASYLSSDYLSLRDKIAELKARKLWIEQMRSGEAAVSARGCITELGYAVSRGDLASADKLILDLEAVLFKKYDGMTQSELDAELQSIDTQIKDLQAQLDSGSSYIQSSTSGIFSYVADGYEGITTGDLYNLSVVKYNKIFDQEPADTSDVLGKIITGISWQYAALIDESAASKIKTGGTYNLLFEELSSRPIPMTVETLSYADNGLRAVVFSSNKYIQKVASLRELEGTIIFDSYEGIRVSKSAVYTDKDGTNYLYILRILQAKRVDIEILSEYEDYYIIKNDGSIPENTEIIVKAKDLYDGKVVQ